MTSAAATEIEQWSRVTGLLGDSGKLLGPKWSGQLHRDPIELALTLSWAKFAAKMACANRSVLELGCGEGIRAAILSEFATRYVGIDADEAAIATARSNWSSWRRSFFAKTRPTRISEQFQTVVCGDVGPCARGGSYGEFFESVLAHLQDDGLCVLGLRRGATPDATAGLESSALAPTYDAHELAAACEWAFRRVLRFEMTDGLVQSSHSQQPEYAILLGICPRARLTGR